MLIILFRTLLLYALVVVVMRTMGKRQIGQLQPFELVITIMLSELAAIPMQDTSIPLLAGIIPIITLLAIQVVLSYVNLRNEKARRIICGVPSVLVENGKIVEAELERLRYNMNDLMEQMRAKSIANLADVEFAILETCGQLSIIPKSQRRPVTAADLGVPTPYEGIPIPLIVDGQVHYQGLKEAELTIAWLQQQLANQGVKHTKDVLYMSIDTTGQIFFQAKAPWRRQGGQ